MAACGKVFRQDIIEEIFEYPVANIIDFNDNTEFKIKDYLTGQV